MIIEKNPNDLKKEKFSYFLKKTKNTLFIVLIGIIIVMLVLVIFLAWYNFVVVKQYQQNLLNIANSIAATNKSLDEKTARFSSAELLLNNTNRILSTIYFGTADTEEKEEAKNFTAFSIIYKDRFYLITAGHCVEFENIKYKNFKFKANNKNIWLYPKLLAYENDYANNKDYAIFYKGNLITMGLYPATDNEDLSPQYVLGNIERDLNFIKRYKDVKQGESGSPVINLKFHVIGIMIKKDGSYTPIQVVLDAIDNENI